MAHLQYNEKDKGFYPIKRKDFNLGWTFYNEKGEVTSVRARTDLTAHEQLLVNHGARLLAEKRRLRPRERLQKGRKRNAKPSKTST